MFNKIRLNGGPSLLELLIGLTIASILIPAAMIGVHLLSGEDTLATAEPRAQDDIINSMTLEEFQQARVQEVLTSSSSLMEDAGLTLPPIEPIKQEQAQALETEEAPVVAAPDKEASGPMDLNALWITLGALGGVGILGVSGAGVRHQLQKSKAFKTASDKAEALLVERWEAANQRHQALEQEYGAYLLDLQEIFKRPALSDLSVLETVIFVESYALLGSSAVSTSKVPEQIIEYEQRVSAAWVAWRRASAQATKLGLGVFTSEERKKVERASQLLKLALDPAASEFERAQAYHQVKKLIDGLIALPEPALLKIEAQVRPALTTLKTQTLCPPSLIAEAPSRA